MFSVEMFTGRVEIFVESYFYTKQNQSDWGEKCGTKKDGKILTIIIN